MCKDLSRRPKRRAATSRPRNHAALKRNPVWKNRALFGKTESCLEKRSSVWENGALSGKTESCLKKRSPVPPGGLAKKSGNPGFPGLPPMDYSELRADERLAVHPIGVATHLAERADLEVIDSSHGQASDDGLPGTGNRSYRPGTEYTTCTFECVAHVESEDAL